MAESLHDKVMVVTGASSGFGRGVALAAAAEGARLVLAARRADVLADLAAECRRRGGEALVAPADVSNANDVADVAVRALGAHDRIDVWVNDAGAAVVGRFDEVPLADHVKVICTDLLGVLFGSYFAVQQFRRQGGGTLINVASILGKVPSPYQASYAAAKHGVVGLSASLRQELGVNHEDGIHVCTVLPTAMDTPFFDHEANYTGHAPSAPNALHDPGDVIETILRLATHPEDEVIVGGDAKLMAVAHAVAPALTESMLARKTHRAQIEEALAAESTPGALRKPSPEGTAVVAGRRDAS